MNREEAIRAMLDGKKVRQPGGTWIFYFSSGNMFLHGPEGGSIYKTDVNSLSSDGWQLYEEPKPKKRYMTREEVLGFVCNTSGIVTRLHDFRWEHPGDLTYFEPKDYEYAYIDEKGNIGEPHKFMVDIS